MDLLCEIVMQLRFEDKAEAMLMRVKAVAAPPPPCPRPEERVKQRKQIIFMRAQGLFSCRRHQVHFSCFVRIKCEDASLQF